MKRLAALLMPLSLAGCWTGPNFYTETPSVQPITAGTYKVVDTYALLPQTEQALALNEPVGARVIISYTKDGDAIVENTREEGGPSQARLVPLDPARGLFIVQYDPGQGAADVGMSVYGLIAVRADGYRLSVPPCDGTRRLSPNSPVIVSGLLFGLNCRFKDRASFETAMLAFADDPVSWTQYRLVQ